VRRTRARQKEIALQRVEILIEQCTDSAKFDMGVARRQAAIARSLCLRFNVRLPYEMRQIFCHGCKNLILPGLNSRIRLSKRRKGLNITCLDCGFIYRKILKSGAEEEQT